MRSGPDPVSAGCAVLQDRQRRQIYLFARSEHRSLSREEVAAACGVTKTLAAFHLDKLVDAGLLSAFYARDPGVGGRGAGRPPKRYVLTDAEVRLSIPARHYEVAGRLLARAIADAGSGGDVERRALELAESEGRGMGREAASASAARAPGLPEATGLAKALGYEPVTEGDGIRFANCPFHALVSEAPDLVCGLNLALCKGALVGMDAVGVEAVLDPHDGQCCVVLRRRS